MGCVERRRSEIIGEGESIVTVNSTTSVKAQMRCGKFMHLHDVRL